MSLNMNMSPAYMSFNPFEMKDFKMYLEIFSSGKLAQTSNISIADNRCGGWLMVVSNRTYNKLNDKLQGEMKALLPGGGRARAQIKRN